MNTEKLQFLLDDLNEVIFDLESISYGSEEEKSTKEWIAFKLLRIKSNIEEEIINHNNVGDQDQRYYFGDEINDF